MHPTKSGIPCRDPILIKLLNVLFMGFWLFSMLTDGFANNIFGWLVWFYLIIRIPMMFPDIIVYQDGIEVIRFWRKSFLPWSKIKGVKASRINSRIYPKSIPLLIRLLAYDSFLVIAWRRNYEYAMKLVEQRMKDDTYLIN